MSGALTLWSISLAISAATAPSSTGSTSPATTDTTSALPSAAQPDPDERTVASLLDVGGERSLGVGSTAGIDELSNAASAAEDEEPYPNLYRKFWFSIGGAAYANFHTQLQVNGNSSVGADLDMEKLLGLNESNFVGRLDGEFAFNKRHRIDFSYYDINRDGERTIANPIDVGNVTIPAGPVHTEFDTRIIKLAYVYDFVTDERTVIGASFGFHVMGIDTSIETTGGSNRESFRVNAPLPVLGLHGAYALSKKWTLSASAEILQFDIGDYRGYVGDNRLTLDHATFDHFGWGIGLNGFEVNGEFQGNGSLGAEMDYGYQGVFLYLRTFF